MTFAIGIPLFLDYMKKVFLLFTLILFFIQLIEGKKGKLKIGKKVKRLFVGKKHKNNSTPKSTTVAVSIKSAELSALSTFTAGLSTVSLSTPTSIPHPTATTFNDIPSSATGQPAEVFITLTDRNYNYFFGYPTPLSGVNYYRNPRFMIAGQRPCGCCDNKIIIVTRAPDDRII